MAREEAEEDQEVEEEIEIRVDANMRAQDMGVGEEEAKVEADWVNEKI